MTTNFTQEHKELFTAACDTILTLKSLEVRAENGILPTSQDFSDCANDMAKALHIEGGAKSVDAYDLAVMQRDKDHALQKLQLILFTTMCFCRYANYTGPEIEDKAILRTADNMASALRHFGLKPGLSTVDLDILKEKGPEYPVESDCSFH